jgi:hypothetical protein
MPVATRWFKGSLKSTFFQKPHESQVSARGLRRNNGKDHKLPLNKEKVWI